MLFSQVAMALHHLQRLVPEDFGRLGQRRAVHGEIGRGSMTAVMEPEIGDLGGCQGLAPATVEVARISEQPIIR